MLKGRKLWRVPLHDSYWQKFSHCSMVMSQVLLWCMARCHVHLMAKGGSNAWSLPRRPRSGQTVTDQEKSEQQLCWLCSCSRVSLKHLSKTYRLHYACRWASLTNVLQTRRKKTHKQRGSNQFLLWQYYDFINFFSLTLLRKKKMSITSINVYTYV